MCPGGSWWLLPQLFWDQRQKGRVFVGATNFAKVTTKHGRDSPGLEGGSKFTISDEDMPDFLGTVLQWSAPFTVTDTTNRVVLRAHFDRPIGYNEGVDW